MREQAKRERATLRRRVLSGRVAPRPPLQVRARRDAAVVAGKLRGDPREGRANAVSPARRRRVASALSRCAGWLQVGSVDLCSDPDAVCSDAKVAAASRPLDV